MIRPHNGWLLIRPLDEGSRMPPEGATDHGKIVAKPQGMLEPYRGDVVVYSQCDAVPENEDLVWVHEDKIMGEVVED